MLEFLIPKTKAYRRLGKQTNLISDISMSNQKRLDALEKQYGKLLRDYKQLKLKIVELTDCVTK